MEPEQQARLEIDRQLAAASWLVQDHKAMNLGAGPGIAVREFPLDTGPVDYLLYAGGKVIGVIEAKPEGHPLKGVEIQSRKYTMGVPAHLPAWRRPPPFAYESTVAGTARDRCRGRSCPVPLRRADQTVWGRLGEIVSPASSNLEARIRGQGGAAGPEGRAGWGVAGEDSAGTGRRGEGWWWRGAEDSHRQAWWV